MELLLEEEASRLANLVSGWYLDHVNQDVSDFIEAKIDEEESCIEIHPKENIRPVEEEFLKTMGITVIFQGEVKNMKNDRKLDMIRSLENALLPEDKLLTHRGLAHIESKTHVTYIAKVPEIVDYLLMKGIEKFVDKGKTYKILFRPWMPRSEWIQQREEEKRSVYWVMALRFPINASFYIKSGIEMVMGKILKEFDPVSDPIDPGLGNLKFQLHPDAEAKYVRSLKVCTGKESLTGDLVNSKTPRCDGCKRYLRLPDECICEDGEEDQGQDTLTLAGRRQDNSANRKLGLGSFQALGMPTASGSMNPQHKSTKKERKKTTTPTKWLNPLLQPSGAAGRGSQPGRGAPDPRGNTATGLDRQGQYTPSRLGQVPSNATQLNAPSGAKGTWHQNIRQWKGLNAEAVPAGTSQGSTGGTAGPSSSHPEGHAVNGATTTMLVEDKGREDSQKRTRPQAFGEDAAPGPAGNKTNATEGTTKGSCVAMPILLKNTNQGPFLMLKVNNQGGYNFPYASVASPPTH
ncbi:hypothetical protein CBR_g1045 [Chara braunii]|uniref:DUF4283 domain-containing protein n=1 Tax=Chara braunii TaxID=69332 RepID=A0A388KCZ5_CHABU|nr:hypothetical protein CBR_g1045 [Chara braunii]|eukprot:GBG67925.1 hypothetical protein CBR_g1045 [Chara braunii]